MRPCERWRVYRQILQDLWDGTSKVSYERFLQGLYNWRCRLRKCRQGDLPDPTPATYSRIWGEFCQRYHLRRSSYRYMKRLLLDGITEGAWDIGTPVAEIIPIAASYLSKHNVVPPASGVLLRLLRTTRRKVRHRRQKQRERLLSHALGTTVSALPLSHRFRVARDILRYPPVSQGKVGVAKLEDEFIVRQEIEATLAANNLSLPELLVHPDLDEAFDFVDRRATSTLHRWELREVLGCLPLYLAVRHRQAVDAIIFTFIRLARLLRFRVKNRSDEQLQDMQWSLFERRGRDFIALRRAVITTLDDGDPSRLKPFRALLRALEEQGESIRTRELYYCLLGRRGTFTRKLAHRLKGMVFEGRDHNARGILSALDEVLRFAPFSENVPPTVYRRLSFLDVDQTRLANRRIFETIVLITLADLLWLGRITSPQSRQFRNIWGNIPFRVKNITGERIHGIVKTVRLNLRHEWSAFKSKTEKNKVIVNANGHLMTRRLSRKRALEEEQGIQRIRQRFLAKRRPISVVDVLMAVHNATGTLKAFQPLHGRGQRLSTDQRTRLALTIVLARGMNIGITQMASLLGRWYTIGRLTSFDECYVNVRNLELANKIILDSWDAQGFGRVWGTGKGVAADGRAIMASEKTLLSGYHYRHRRSGVTLYWLVRDDWIASRVGVIGNHEWESWYLLDGMLHPVGGNPAEWATGDTHGQHLALWGLACLTGKSIHARFRRLSQVRLYNDGPVSSLPLRGVQRIRWSIIERAIPSLIRLVAAVQEGIVDARDILRSWNLYDEDGINISEALRELGKAERTGFILCYATDETLRREIRDGCNRAETWNSFQEAVFWGHGGRMRTTDPRRRDINALCMQLIMNSIVFYNALRFKKKLAVIRGSCPAMWEHIRFLGDFRITKSRLTIGKSEEK
jgi:TnpA family transposase